MLHRDTQDPQDDRFTFWLESGPDESDLRETYLELERRRADLWSSSNPDSYAADRFDLDARYVHRLVAVKRALVEHARPAGSAGAEAGDTAELLHVNLLALKAHLKACFPRPGATT
jgi:hypothetical protein